MPIFVVVHHQGLIACTTRAAGPCVGVAPDGGELWLGLGPVGPVQHSASLRTWPGRGQGGACPLARWDAWGGLNTRVYVWFGPEHDDLHLIA